MFLDDPRNLTWKCHICGKERPDTAISVYKKPFYLHGQLVGEQNIRYCNDNPDCYKGAMEFSFIKKES
jgi:hypothetical protein